MSDAGSPMAGSIAAEDQPVSVDGNEDQPASVEVLEDQPASVEGSEAADVGGDKRDDDAAVAAADGSDDDAAAAAAAAADDDDDDAAAAATDGAADGDDDDNDNDRDSDLLSEVDEDQFEDYDPSKAQIDNNQPVNIDQDAAKTLKVSKRKRADTDGPPAKKAKESRREKKRRTKSSTNDDLDIGGQVVEGKRARKVRYDAGTKRTKPKAKPSSGAAEGGAGAEEDEEQLTPEERRRRAIEQAMDDALKNPYKRRRKRDEVDLEEAADEQIAQLKVQMERACIADNTARDNNRPATQKLLLLPQVMSILNRNDIQETVLDPETNFLQSVRFFLEPLNDGSLPAFQIQQEIFKTLTRLPVERDVLLSSGMGKVVLFYTRSKQAQLGVKRMAERLLGEWSRPILKRTDDYRKRHVETREFDNRSARMARDGRPGANSGSGSQITVTQRPAVLQRLEAERQRALAPVNTNPNRAMPVGLPRTYTVAPKSTYDASARPADFRPIGAGGLEAFRKMAAKAKARKN